MLKKEKKRQNISHLRQSEMFSGNDQSCPYSILLVLCVVKVAKNTVYRLEEIYADQEPMTQSKSS